jgi:hypothetical protein
MCLTVQLFTCGAELTNKNTLSRTKELLVAELSL